MFTIPETFITLLWHFSGLFLTRVWALPFVSILAPSERYHHEQGKTHKVLTDWARQMFKQVRRWMPERTLVFVGDSSFAVLELLHAELKIKMSKLKRGQADDSSTTPL
jgi:hypothetical protein